MATSRHKPKQFCFVLSTKDARLLARLAKKMGVSKAEILRVLIWRAADASRGFAGLDYNPYSQG